jgi:hypothetical protein
MHNFRLIAASALLLPVVAFGQGEQKPDPMRAYFHDMQALASKGDAQAEECLAELYTMGMGTSADLDQARKLLDAAAAAGDFRAKERQAQSYTWDESNAQDISKAIVILQGLSDKGYLPATSDLALMYLNGTGMPKDQAKALSLYRKAAAGGDYEAEMRLGLFYHVGDNGLPKDQKLSRQWLEKAAGHTVDCVPTFGNLVNFIISGYLPTLDAKHNWGPTAPLNIMYTYQDGRAKDAYIKLASGIPEFDQGWLAATRAAKLPPWPPSYHGDDKTLGFFIQGNEGDLDFVFAKKLHDAIKAAMVMPLDVLVHGSKSSGSVNVGLDYRDGKVSNANVVTSSGEPSEDAAALKAVETAAYPSTPKRFAHKTYHMGFRIEFGQVTPSRPATTSAAPVAASGSSQ